MGQSRRITINIAVAYIDIDDSVLLVALPSIFVSASVCLGLRVSVCDCQGGRGQLIAAPFLCVFVINVLFLTLRQCARWDPWFAESPGKALATCYLLLSQSVSS